MGMLKAIPAHLQLRRRLERLKATTMWRCRRSSRA